MKSSQKKGLTIVLIGCGVLTLGFGALIYLAFEKIDEETQTIESKKTELEGLTAKTKQIPALEKKVVILREVVQDYLRTLPSSKEVNDYIRTIYGFQDESGVVISELQDMSAKGNSNAKNKEPGFDKVTYHLKLTGSLWEYLSFLSRLESHERYIQVSKLKIQSGERKKEEEASKTKHSFDMDLETYVFNPTGAAKSANIQNYTKRVNDLQEDIMRAKDKVLAEPFEYHGARGRRDPFIDPRLPVAAGEGGEEMLRKQVEIVEQLRSELAQIGQMVIDHAQATQMIRRFELRRDIEQSINALVEKVNKVEKEGKITYLPLVRRMQKDVIDSLADLRSRFDPKGGSIESGPSREELTEIAKRIQEHLAEGEFSMAMDRFNLVADRLKNIEQDPERQELVVLLRQLQRDAFVAQDFGKKKIAVQGIIVSEQGSVAVINGRAFGEGEFVDDDLMIRRIHSDSIEFVYREVVISKKI